MTTNSSIKMLVIIIIIRSPSPLLKEDSNGAVMEKSYLTFEEKYFEINCYVVVLFRDLLSKKILRNLPSAMKANGS